VTRARLAVLEALDLGTVLRVVMLLHRADGVLLSTHAADPFLRQEEKPSHPLVAKGRKD